jgi:hypothetical protein
MRAKINGIVVDGTPKELAEFAKQMPISQPSIIIHGSQGSQEHLQRVGEEILRQSRERKPSFPPAFVRHAISKRKRSKK